jgi:hypothetical protein
MAYDEALADRVRRSLGSRSRVEEKPMFDGRAFLLSGRMVCAVINHNLMVRVGPERYLAALREANTGAVGVKGSPLAGYVFVGPAGCRNDERVAAWVERAVSFVSSLGTVVDHARA